MKALKSLLVVAALGLASTAAMAQVAVPEPQPVPGNPPLPTTGSSGLIVSIWDVTQPISLVLYLGLDFLDVLPSAMTPEEGLVLDFGAIQGYGATFGSSDPTNLRYTVFATDGTGSGTSLGVLTTAALGANAVIGATINQNITGIVTAANNFFGQLAQSCAGLNPCIQDGDVNNPAPDAETGWGARYNGSLTSISAAGTVGEALGFYYMQPSSRTNSSQVNLFTYEAFGNAGQWLLDTAGRLVYSFAGGTVVPLPAAVWLLLSGLAGVGVVGRRRAATA